ncbi:50S ribosomal protein L9 [Cesiribacter sp. SM1]|uniref:50S ribosomal protein L9 n=1 Tax=Cesiribacter sp. SM1 TaxID=2861196 RepID=UPI001CD2B9A8|nr:50S ribosomal protein L9 [Cesiribacter sp. SM1]
MEIILKKDIKGLGYRNDLVNVKPGYARNYLIPEGYAVMATTSAVKQRDETIKQVAHKAEKIKTDAETLANAIGDAKLTIPAKAGESGKIFGAVTTTQIAEALKAKGHDVDRKQISINGEVKSLGEYTAEIDLHKEVKKTINFEVIAE